MGGSRVASCLLASAMALGALVVAQPAPGAAEEGLAVDVLIAFDTTGSMGGALSEGKSQVLDAIQSVRTSYPNSYFAAAAVADYPPDTPWTLLQGLTADSEAIASSIQPLVASGGGDGPEAYGRALYEAVNDPSIGWRSGSKRLLVLVNDNVPHDDDLNEGVPIESRTFGSPFSTGVDLGRDGISGTDDDIDWQTALQGVKDAGIVFANVFYSGWSNYVPYWEWWTGLTGGSTVTNASAAPLGDLLVDVVEGGVNGGQRVVVSFGDSIAAGEGSGDHTGYPNNPFAYGGRIGAKLGWQSHNFAISGACAATSGKGGVWGTPAECTKSVAIDQIPLAASMNLRPDLVTLTVGANDIRFSSCVIGVLGFDDASPCTGKVFDDHLKALKLNLGGTLAKIRDLYGPDVPIVVTRYFSPVPGYAAPPTPVCPLMPAAALAKTYYDSGGRAAVWAVRDLDKRARDYQAAVSDKTLRILGQLNKTLTETATPFGVTMVGLNFAGHDFCTDYDGNDDAWVFAPLIEAFASYYGVGGATYERSLIPAHRCVETPECDTTTKFINKSGVWNGQTWTINLVFLSNDFPHLTKPGQDEVADRVIAALGL